MRAIPCLRDKLNMKFKHRQFFLFSEFQEFMRRHLFLREHPWLLVRATSTLIHAGNNLICRHSNINKVGSNAYQRVRKCKDCDYTEVETLEKFTKMQTGMVSSCVHADRDFRGTTAATLKWKCRTCGRQETGNKMPGQTGKSAAASASSSTSSVPAATPRAVPIEFWQASRRIAQQCFDRSRDSGIDG